MLVLAAALRAGHLAALYRLPSFDVLLVDSWMYDAWAQRLAAGDWSSGTRPFYMEPLYPYLLAGLYRWFGRDLMMVHLLQVVFGVATCGIVAGIGRQVAGRPAGNLAALLIAIYRPTIFQEGEIEKTALGVLLLTSALLLILRSSPGSRLAAGLLAGLAVLCRGNLLLLLPLSVAWIALERGMRSSPERTAAFRSALLFILGAALAIGPVAARNRCASGEWVLTTSGAGQVLYTGNNPENASGGFVTPRFVRSHPQFEEEDFRAAAEAAVGRPLSAREVSEHWLRESLEHIAANPGFAARVAARKAALVVSDFEVPDAWDLAFLSRYSPVLALPLPGMAMFLALAALGISIGAVQRQHRFLLLGFLGAYAASLVLFFVLSRYRLYLAPVLAVFGGAGIAALATAVAGRRWRIVVWGLAWAGGAGLCSVFAMDPTPYAPGNLVHSQLNLASAFQSRGDLPNAERLVEEAVRLAPDLADPICQRGRFFASVHRIPEAEADLLRCIEIDSAYPEVWLMLGRLYLEAGSPAHAAAAFKVQLRLTPGMKEAEEGLAAADRAAIVAPGASDADR